MEEYAKEKAVCEKIGKNPPPKPIPNVINVTPEMLLSLDFDELEQEVSMGMDIDKYLTDELLANNKKRIDDEYESAMIEYHENNLDVKEELNSPEDAKLYLKLTREGYPVPIIRELLRLSRASADFTDDIIANYFSPDMDINEVRDCVDLLIP